MDSSSHGQRLVRNTLHGVVRRWMIGNRVTRIVFLDDGTWRREGDKCLKHSPLRHGTVVRRSTSRNDEAFVLFDDGETLSYLDHGLDAESSNPSHQEAPHLVRRTLDGVVGNLKIGS